MAKPTTIQCNSPALAAAIQSLFEKAMQWVLSSPNHGYAPLVDDLKRVWAAGIPGECPIAKDIYIKEISGDTIKGGLFKSLFLQGKDDSGVPVRVCIDTNERWMLASLMVEYAIKVKVPVPTHRLESVSIDLSDDFVVYEFESDRPPPRDAEDRDWDDYFDSLDDDDEEEAGGLDDKIEKARAELERLETAKAKRERGGG